MTALSFRRVEAGNGHRYTLNGRAIPGVTSLLDKGVPKPAIARWGARTVAEYVADNPDRYQEWADLGRDSLVGLLAGVPWGERDRAARAGTEVHTLAQRLAAGDEVDVPDELQGHVDAYFAFYDDWQPTDEIAERPCLNRRWRYAGTFDLLCTIEPFGRVLIDFKTSKSGIWPETALQLAAYRNAELYEGDGGTLEPMPEVAETLGLWLRGDGYDLYRVESGPDVFRQFLYVADVANNFATVKREAFIGPSIQPQRGRLKAV